MYQLIYRILAINTRCFADMSYGVMKSQLSSLYLEICANARRIYVYGVINPLFLTPLGVR